MVYSDPSNFREIDETAAASREALFEEILRRIKESNGKITLDETSPLYDELGEEEAEIGSERIVEFKLQDLEFRLIRKVQNYRFSGTGRHKSLEALTKPFVNIFLSKKAPMSDDWTNIDLNEIF